jgi:hypothetical protein
LKQNRHTARCLLLVVSVLLLLPAYVAARAGGGEGYSGGGGGGHGGGGGGGGNGTLIIDLIFFCLSHPTIGVPLLIVIVVAVIYFQMTSANQPGGGVSAPNLMRGPVTEPIDAIRQHDPAFDPAAFCNRVGAGFLKLQTAWCGQTLQEVRPFISDGIHERFSLQFAEQQADGYRDRMDNVGIDQIMICDGRSDDIYDEVSVRIVAHAADYKVSLRGGLPVAPGSPIRIEPFAEIWSFLRRRGSATVPGKPGLLEGNCPNCGAPIELNESANCANCHALLRSGQYDWVLSEITQDSEWQPGAAQRTPGLVELRKLDADLNVQSLEDRVSVIFWRKSAADRLGKLDPMFKVTSPAYGKTYAGRLKPTADGSRNYYGHCAVGAVNVLGFMSGADVDRALVEVKWSGVKLLVRAGGVPQLNEPNFPHRTLFVLMRKAGSKTDVAKGISSAHCPSCGAPENGGIGGACEYCGAALNDGSNGWVLDNLMSFDDPAAMELLRQLNIGQII